VTGTTGGAGGGGGSAAAAEAEARHTRAKGRRRARFMGFFPGEMETQAARARPNQGERREPICFIGNEKLGAAYPHAAQTRRLPRLAAVDLEQPSTAAEKRIWNLADGCRNETRFVFEHPLLLSFRTSTPVERLICRETIFEQQTDGCR
jgi:hypothetical protein